MVQTVAGLRDARASAGMVPWWRDAVIYQIYPRSFADSDGNGIGDLRGVIERLDYLNDGAGGSLGVDAVWLSPFYPSPGADHGYDVSGYTGVDPLLGTLEDFDHLLGAAHARGIRVLIDLVINHTSVEHPWFRASRSSRADPKRDWYVWAPPGPGGSPPNNWLSAFERVGSAWTLDEATGECYLHTFTPGQADLNWRNPEVRAAIGDVMRFWLERGVDGFRVDVAHRLVKDEALRDNPPVLAHERRHVSHPWARQRNADHPDVHEVLRELRRTTDEYDAVLLGEVPIHDPARLARYYGDGDELHMAFNFALWDVPWRARAWRHVVDALLAHLPARAWPCTALSNHDIPRTVTRFGSDGRGRQRARVAAMLLLTLPGTPCLYAGEEIGMAGGGVSEQRRRDIDDRDESRTPMQWDPSGRGFSSGRSWLPVAPDAAVANVAVQRHDPASVLSLYRRLIRRRRGSPALRRGTYEPLHGPAEVFAYRRAARGEQFVVALNFSSRHQRLRHHALPRGTVVEVCTDPARDGEVLERHLVELGPDEGVVLRLPPAGAGRERGGRARAHR